MRDTPPIWHSSSSGSVPEMAIEAMTKLPSRERDHCCFFIHVKKMFHCKPSSYWGTPQPYGDGHSPVSLGFDVCCRLEPTSQRDPRQSDTDISKCASLVTSGLPVSQSPLSSAPPFEVWPHAALKARGHGNASASLLRMPLENQPIPLIFTLQKSWFSRVLKHIFWNRLVGISYWGERMRTD